MIVRYCDACKAEVGSLNQLKIPCHLWSKENKIGYCDFEGNRVSGRMDCLDLCNKCTNRVYTCLVKEIKEILNDR